MAKNNSLRLNYQEGSLLRNLLNERVALVRKAVEDSVGAGKLAHPNQVKFLADASVLLAKLDDLDLE